MPKIKNPRKLNQRRNLTLDDGAVKRLRKMGGGNLSKGVRIASLNRPKNGLSLEDINSMMYDAFVCLESDLSEDLGCTGEMHASIMATMDNFRRRFSARCAAEIDRRDKNDW